MAKMDKRATKPDKGAKRACDYYGNPLDLDNWYDLADRVQKNILPLGIYDLEMLSKAVSLGWALQTYCMSLSRFERLSPAWWRDSCADGRLTSIFPSIGEVRNLAGIAWDQDNGRAWGFGPRDANGYPEYVVILLEPFPIEQLWNGPRFIQQYDNVNEPSLDVAPGSWGHRLAQQFWQELYWWGEAHGVILRDTGYDHSRPNTNDGPVTNWKIIATNCRAILWHTQSSQAYLFNPVDGIPILGEPRPSLETKYRNLAVITQYSSPLGFWAEFPAEPEPPPADVEVPPPPLAPPAVPPRLESPPRIVHPGLLAYLADLPRAVGYLLARGIYGETVEELDGPAAEAQYGDGKPVPKGQGPRFSPRRF